MAYRLTKTSNTVANNRSQTLEWKMTADTCIMLSTAGLTCRAIALLRTSLAGAAMAWSVFMRKPGIRALHDIECVALHRAPIGKLRVKPALHRDRRPPAGYSYRRSASKRLSVP